MKFSPQQDMALKAVDAWLKDGSEQVFYLAGYAGTGKTTLAVHLSENVGQVMFGAFTGKAALVMRSKGCRKASTIHSMIYRLDEENEGDPTFVLNQESDVGISDLVIVDECSMVGEELGKDLLSFGTKVLVLGDPAQLPPVKDAGYFTERKPDIMLTEIHRQALDNPIIAMSIDIREGKTLSYGEYGASKVIPRDKVDSDMALRADQILVGMNRTRHKYNHRFRQLKGFDDKPMPQPKERLICLKNNRPKRLLNGQMFEVLSCEPNSKDGLLIEAKAEGEKSKRKSKLVVHPYFLDGREDELEWQTRKLFDEFTYGYAVTVHKAQGSQWDDVLLFDESSVFREEARRWLYTGITRAAEKVTVVL